MIINAYHHCSTWYYNCGEGDFFPFSFFLKVFLINNMVF